MKKCMNFTGKNVDEAINNGLESLSFSREDVEIEVIEEGSQGILGIGAKQAEVKITYDESEESEDEVYYGDDESFEGEQITEAEDKAVSFVAGVLSGIGIHGNLDSYREDDTIYISVTGPECGNAIGHHGETLDAISYMTNLVANKASEERVHVHLDIDGYRKHREQVIINLADKASYKAKKSGRKIFMEAMTPAERRIVHSYLQNVDGVTTQSEGEEPRRKVVVIPLEN